MPKFFIGAKTERRDVLMELHKLLPDLSLLDLRTALASGAPFVERLYPFNDREDVAVLLRAIVTKLEAEGIEPIIYVTDDDEDLDVSDDSKRETPEVMENLLHMAEEIHEEYKQRDNQG